MLMTLGVFDREGGVNPHRGRGRDWGRDIEAMISAYLLKRPVEMGVGFARTLSVQAAGPAAGVTASGAQGDRPGRRVSQTARSLAMPGEGIRGNGPGAPPRMKPFGHPPMRNHVK